MAINGMTDDVEVISKLSDTPNDTLTAAQLKAKFDTAGVLIKTYINDTLVTAINSVLGLISGGYLNIAKIQDGSITRAKLADNIINASKLEDGAVGTGKIVDSAVTSAKIADGNVTANKLSASSVATAKIVDEAVTTDKLASTSVTTAKIADGAITTGKIAHNAVDTGNIADGVVTMSKTNFVEYELSPSSDSYVPSSKAVNDFVNLKNYFEKKVVLIAPNVVPSSIPKSTTSFRVELSEPIVLGSNGILEVEVDVYGLSEKTTSKSGYIELTVNGKSNPNDQYATLEAANINIQCTEETTYDVYSPSKCCKYQHISRWRGASGTSNYLKATNSHGYKHDEIVDVVGALSVDSINDRPKPNYITTLYVYDSQYIDKYCCGLVVTLRTY